MYNASGLAYYRHSDWLGSSRLSSTQARGLYSSTSYAPFGEQYASTGTPDPSYTGQNSDTVSSLYDFPARRLSPSQGRWISPDPLGIAAVDPTTPQTWNRYAYVANSPLIFSDPSGLVLVVQCDGNGENCYEYDDGTGTVDDGYGDVGLGGSNPCGSSYDYCGSAYGGDPSTCDMSDPTCQFTYGDNGGQPYSIPPNSGYTNFKPLFCTGDALAAKGVSIGLDAIGAIPGLGNLVSEGAAIAGVIRVAPSVIRATSALVNNVSAYGLGALGGAMAVADPEGGLDSIVGAGSAGTGIGLALADATLGGTKAIPLIGNAVSVGTGAFDIYMATKAYQNCMKSPKYD